MLECTSDVRRTNCCGLRDRNEHVNCWGLAKRDQQDVVTWQARDHTDGQLHNGLQHLELADARLCIRTARHRMEGESGRWGQLKVCYILLIVHLQFPLAFQVFFTICIWLLCPFLPDSPRLLIRKGKYDEAKEVIAALEGHGATPDSPEVKNQFNVIKDILDREHVNTYSWWQLITGRGPSGILRRMLLGAWMQVMNQISGINVTSYYMSYIFINALGISEILSRVLAACGSVDYLIFACLAYFVIERYGRRKVMVSLIWSQKGLCRPYSLCSILTDQWPHVDVLRCGLFDLLDLHRNSDRPYGSWRQ